MNTIRHIFTHNMVITIVVLTFERLELLRDIYQPAHLGLVVEWAIQHKEELLVNWRNVEQKISLSKIAPLQ